MADKTQKVALVTGANKGIGLEIARQLGKQGFVVYLGCRDKDRGAKAAAELKADGVNAIAAALDVTDTATISATVAQVEQEHGKLDVLVNNAGIALDWGTKPSETSSKNLRTVFETNFFGVIATTQAFLPLLRKAPAARIVNMSSSLGSLARHSHPDGMFKDMVELSYNTSKTALNAATQEFANELRDTPIKVNAVCPGYVATDINNHGGPRTTQQGAQIAVKMATIGADGPTGGYFEDDGAIPW